MSPRLTLLSTITVENKELNDASHAMMTAYSAAALVRAQTRCTAALAVLVIVYHFI